MNTGLSGYFDDAHRGLQRKQTERIGKSASDVQLPPLRPDSGPPFVNGSDQQIISWDKGSLQQSHSLGSLMFSDDRAAVGIQAERYQQTLQDNAKLARKVRTLQDRLAITSAKKEAFEAQAQRLEKEFRKGREQSDTLQRDLLEAKREAGQLTNEAQEAMQMMTEMRKAHIHEVRLLQRGLAARGNDEKSRNRVNEMADLVDKLGRAVVQRDESIRDKMKMQATLSKAQTDVRAVSDDCGRLRKQNQKLQADLKEAQRRAKFVVPASAGPPEDSDDEFERELSQFEKRFQILEDGPAGLDILASNLSKDKQTLEKRLKSANDTISTLNGTIDNWKQLGAEKDEQIRDLSEKLDRMKRDQALLEEQIAQKRREIQLQVAEEKAALERRVSELEQECDNARAGADGMEKTSNRLTRELVKVHEQYTREPGDDAGGEAGGAGPAEPATAGEGIGGELVASAEQGAKTGEMLRLDVYRAGEVVELHAREVPSGEECRMQLPRELLQELDQEDPWTELFSRVGVSPGPPRRAIVVSSLLGRREVSLQPEGVEMILTAYRYGRRRFFFSGLNLDTQHLVELTVMEGQLTPEVQSQIDAAEGNDALFDILSFRLAYEGDALHFRS